jgi:negative regulator of sigma E activity
MTHDERISAYIDNELSADQEQEFLISLAASNGLRKSFRSELVMKNVLHRDEMVTNPPREMRAALFATLGIGAIAVTASKADAAQPASNAGHSVASHSLLKTFFATKMSALVTAIGISISALAGYGVHSIVDADHVSSAQQTEHVSNSKQSNPVNAAPSMEQPAPVNSKVAMEAQGTSGTATQSASGLNHTTYQNAVGASHRTAMLHRAIREASTPSEPAPPVSGVSGSGEVGINPAVINKK